MKTKRKLANTFGYHLRLLTLLILIAGLPLAIIAGIYQQTTISSHAQIAQIMPNDVLSQLTPPPGCYYSYNYKTCPLQQAIACRSGSPCSCSPDLTCPQVTNFPTPSCIPLPCPPGKYCPYFILCGSPSITPPSPMPSCGSVRTLPNGQYTYAVPGNAETCFLQSFQSCSTVSLSYSVSGVDTLTTHSLSVQNSNSSESCLVTDSVTNQVFPIASKGGRSYKCSGVLPLNGGLEIQECGDEGNIIIPPVSLLTPKPTISYPTTIMTPGPTCFPRPQCLDQIPSCKLPQPAIGWCSPQVRVKGTQKNNQNTFLIFINSMLRKLL